MFKNTFQNLGLTQKQLAEALNVSQPTINLWLSQNTLPAERARSLYEKFPHKVKLWELRPDLWKRNEMSL